MYPKGLRGFSTRLEYCSGGPVSGPPRLLRSSPHHGLYPAYTLVDLSEQLSDPVDVLFGTQLGGGTDIDQALAYCQQIITRPAQTILVLVTDLYEGGNAQRMLQRAAALVQSGVTVVCLLALSAQAR